jgi:23S rRNA (uridine2552-2'-O)-methyltransferase
LSRLSDRRRRHDQFHRKARERGFAARSVFKLSEIDERYQLIRPGARVLDLGCRPGSWLQYCARKQAGALVGIDRQPISLAVPNTRIVVGDVLEATDSDLLGELDHFDVVLSDMAPDTSGIRHLDQARSEVLFECALGIAERTLATGGHFVAKLFQGPDFQRLIARCRKGFATVKMVKPKGSRSDSIEQYVVAMGFRSTEP